MLLIARRYGQLGNRLTLFAHMIAASREYDVTLSNVCFAEYAEYFEGTRTDLWCRYPEKRSDTEPSYRARRIAQKLGTCVGNFLATTEPLVKRSRGLSSLARVVQLNDSEHRLDLGCNEVSDEILACKLWVAQGWLFRSERLLEKHQQAIREYFRLAPQHADVVARQSQAMRARNDFIIGIHIRGGDYANWHDGKYFYAVEDYVQIMRSLVDQKPNAKIQFLVCSNEQLQAEQFPGLDVSFGPGHLVQDLYLLAETDMIVGPPSTFSGWAAFYGDKPLAVLESRDTPVILPELCSKSFVAERNAA